MFARVKRKQPRLKTPQQPAHSSTQISEEKPAEAVFEAPVTVAVQDSSAQQKPVKNPRGVFFAFNGHEWEAHEVLGCKIGEGLDAATQVYQQLLRTSDPSTFDFYEAAFNAILKSKR